MKKWLNANPGLAVVYGFVLLIIIWFWSWMPYPYSPRYIVNRILFTPQFVCADGVYSWAKTRTGACSSHGGVQRRYE